ncbi:MAG: MBL fold metallo-hydrolase [Actinobacteria bacterium]|nr:MBL fold metallo-hydrolase [Actinomycetota bacterium]
MSFNIRWLNSRVGYIDAPTTIGVLKSDNSQVILVDSGLNKEAARKLLKTLENEGLNLVAVINTHSHADHCGGSAFLKERLKCRIFAPSGEAEILENPYWEPFYLFGGSPIKEMQVSFLMTQGVKVDGRLEPGKLRINSLEIEILALPGHTPHQAGVMVDDFIFASDSLFTEELWEKHFFVYFSNIEKTIQTLNFLKSLKKKLILSHRGLCEDPVKLVEFNLRKIEETADIIYQELGENALSTDELLKKVSDKKGVNLKDAPSYFLARQTLISYLSYLKEIGKIGFKIEDNAFLWMPQK